MGFWLNKFSDWKNQHPYLFTFTMVAVTSLLLISLFNGMVKVGEVLGNSLWG